MDSLKIKPESITSSPDRELLSLTGVRLLQKVKEDSIKTLLFTSAMPGEGVFHTVAKVGKLMADEGTRVVILDCGQRSMAQKRLLNLINGAGLPNLKVAILQTVNWRHDSSLMEEVFSKLRETSDIVLVVAPPILAVADAVKLAAITDGVVLVIKAAKTKQSLLQQAIKRLEQTNIVGAILNTMATEAVEVMDKGDNQAAEILAPDKGICADSDPLESIIEQGFDAKMSGKLDIAILFFSIGLQMSPPADIEFMLISDINNMSNELEGSRGTEGVHLPGKIY
jgi:Mrp family chromosome partitioning ATPase